MEQIGRYQIREELARGGMGLVYRGYDTKKRFEVAIKLLLAGRSATEQARKRFLREARALGKLRHPHIVAVDEVGEHDGNPYLVLELLASRTTQHYYRGNARREQGDLRGAIGDWTEAIRLDPNAPWADRARQRRDQAIAALEE